MLVLALTALLAACRSDKQPLVEGSATTAATTTTAETATANGSGSGSSDDGTSGPAPGQATIPTPAPGQPPVSLRVDVVARHPHDTGAFTEGLALQDGRLFESTGLEGDSTIREVDLDSGRVLHSTTLARDQFGEGLAVVGDELVQLTWKNGVAIVWGRDDLQELRRLPLSGEGWGLCLDVDGKRLVQTDGTATLIFRDPTTFAETGRVAVTQDGKPLDRLNELECSNDGVWANVWKTSSIVRIDPASGRVTAVVNAAGLAPDGAGKEDVLNGIAHKPDGTWLVTGKRWPTLYVVRFVPT